MEGFLLSTMTTSAMGYGTFYCISMLPMKEWKGISQATIFQRAAIMVSCQSFSTKVVKFFYAAGTELVH